MLTEGCSLHTNVHADLKCQHGSIFHIDMFTFGTVYLKIPFEIELNNWKKTPIGHRHVLDESVKLFSLQKVLLKALVNYVKQPVPEGIEMSVCSVSVGKTPYKANINGASMLHH